MIKLTENAVSEIKRIMAEQNMDPQEVGLRLRVVGGGCAGFQTKLDLDEEYFEDADTLEIIEGIRVVVDNRSSLYLQGTSVDYIHDLNKHGFSVTNPGVKSVCGCGSSWSM